MDFGIENEATWDWQELDCSLAEGPQYEISPWTEITNNQENVSRMDNDATPVKACADVSWKVSDCDDLMKESGESRVCSSQAKRRRVLQFSNDPVEFPLRKEELPSAHMKTKAREESEESLLPEISPLDDLPTDFMSASDFEMIEPDEWLADLLNGTDMNSEDMTTSAASDVQFSLSDFCKIQPNHEALEAPSMQKFAPPAPQPAPKKLNGKVIFKGRRSFIQTPIKLASSVAYPFTIIKPCPAKGGMTLQDINQKIHTQTKKPQPLPPNLPKSAFSGKLVVGKTRIRTEGGKGSITIMRTRG